MRAGGAPRPARVLPFVGLVVFCAAWELIGHRGAFGGSIPSLTAVVREISSDHQVILTATRASMARAAVGGVIGLALGVLVAVLTALVPRSTSHVVRAVVLVNALPVVALGPILMSLPVRPATPQVFAALSVLFSTVVTVSDGFRSAASSSRDVFATYGAGRTQQLIRLQLPAAVPFIADALRLAVPAALLGAILGEWFGADTGLGVLMVSAMRNVQYELLWGATVMAVLVSAAGYALATWAERISAVRFGRPTVVRDDADSGSRRVDVATGVAIPVVLVACWQWWISAQHVPTVVAPSPHRVLTSLVDDWHGYLHAAGLTLLSAAGGLACGLVLGVGLALLATLMPPVRAFFSPLALLVPTIPIVVFVPILGAVIGYGMGTVLASCVLMAFFPVYVIVLSGLGARPAGSDDVFRIYGADRFAVLRRLALPAALPSLFIAVRLAAANCVLIAISAEWLMDRGGLGRIFADEQVTLDTGAAWGSVVVAMVLSVLAYRSAAAAEKWAGRRWS
ncbi:ABC transporter permease subunit [Nocardioides sp. BP30]|uniref:ABC transporter permease n=1 Tax=Nocardioides sp. BP30 TaxID=3036374 RepID=UPI002468E4E8|nr:ABC transporter permease subunit [Nocardioides sp. BP30]WGL53975.1 ABC transporter permease subunit [Nocardioides sp. BP30]